MASTTENVNKLALVNFLEAFNKHKNVTKPDGISVKQNPVIFKLMTYVGIQGITSFNEALR